VDLSIKGFVSILPRKGVFVNDYRKTGSCALLSSLFHYREGEFENNFFQSLIDMRLLIEVKTASLAALNRTKEHIKEFKSIIEAEEITDINDDESLTELDFSLHRLISIASGNLVYPLIINSFQDVYTSVTSLFYKNFKNSDKIEFVKKKHRELVDAIIKKNKNAAEDIMRIILNEGEKDIKYLRGKR
jgi:DNA-binding FadR family transcriptional regulator